MGGGERGSRGQAQEPADLARSLVEARRPQPDARRSLAVHALDLRRSGRADLAERLLSSFAGQANDFELYAEVDDLERELALERARASDATGERHRWRQLARATRRPPLLPPMLVAVGGGVASGKSTIARRIAARMAAPHIEADRARRQLEGGRGLAGLEERFEDSVYDELLRRAEVVLGSGRPVVLDACFPRCEQRERARSLARERGLPFLFVECRIDEDTRRERLAAREQGSGPGGATEPGAWLRIHGALEERWESTDHLSPESHLVLDCSRPLADSEAILAERIPCAPGGHALP